MQTVWKVTMICGVLVLLLAACCRKAPQAVVDANSALNSSQQTCTPTYAASAFKEAKSMVAKANDLVANKKCCDAKKEAVVAMQKIKNADNQANTEQAQAKSAAMSAVQEARSAVSAASSDIRAQADSSKAANDAIITLVNKPAGACNKAELVGIGTEIKVSGTASATYRSARSKLDEAKRTMQESACNYYKVKTLAEEALALANRAKSQAQSETAQVQSERQAKVAAINQALDAKPCSYTVKKGDCLWKISARDKIYSNPFLWPLIWDTNKGLIKNHPDLIYPDWSFQINRTYSADDAKTAEHTARYHKWTPPAPPAPENVAPEPKEAPAPPAPAPAPAPAPTTAPSNAPAAGK